MDVNKFLKLGVLSILILLGLSFSNIQKCSAETSCVPSDEQEQRIFDAAESFGAEVVMTSADHPSGTDRLEEVVTKLKLSNDDIVVNVQGDEPLIPPEVIDQVAQNLASQKMAGVATHCEKLTELEQIFNPNAVKVVFAKNGLANYFSRAPIPWARDSFSALMKSDQQASQIPAGAEYFRHIGIYAYRVGFLKNYVTWPPSMTEETECLEQLRALSNGVDIHVEEALLTPPAGVDTEEDLLRLRKLMSN